MHTSRTRSRPLPPARQAAHCLPGKRGVDVTAWGPVQTPFADLIDLPLTREVRARRPLINLAAMLAAMFAIAWFAGQLLLAIAR
jgi:hypothetical protein